MIEDNSANQHKETDPTQTLRRDFGALVDLLDKQVSVQQLPEVSFYEAPTLKGELCDDMYGALPYGLFVLPDAVVFGASGTLFSSDARPLLEQNFGYNEQKDLLVNVGRMSTVTSGEDRCTHLPHALSLLSPCCYCFWHWIMDCIPKVLLAEESGYTGSYLIPPRVMTPWAQESMKLLGIDPARVVEHTTNAVLVDMLYIPTYFSGYKASKNLPLIRRLRGLIRQAVEGSALTNSPERLFVPRKFTATYRRILNFDAVQGQLAQYGFETLFFEDFPFLDQLRISAHASAIVSPHGSGLTHTLFMREESTVMELFPFKRRRSCRCYEVLMPVAKHRYYSLDTQRDCDTDIEVDVEQLQALLQRHF